MKQDFSSHENWGEYSLHVLNPTVRSKYKPLSPAPRLTDLNNKKIGLHWNTKARGDVALMRVKDLLAQRYAGMTFEWFHSAVNIGVPEDWFEQVKRSGVDGVVGTTGD